MKLYVFNSNGYGDIWFVCAESREAAIEACRNRIKKDYDKDVAKDFELANDHRSYQEKHLEACVAGARPYKGADHKCSIDEVEPGEVVFSEVS